MFHPRGQQLRCTYKGRNHVSQAGTAKTVWEKQTHKTKQDALLMIYTSPFHGNLELHTWVVCYL